VFKIGFLCTTYGKQWAKRCKFINNRTFGWIGHTLKKDGEIPKAAIQRNRHGSRKKGRPKNSWRRSVIKEVGEVGMN
jgi:hypothetical protein